MQIWAQLGRTVIPHLTPILNTWKHWGLRCELRWNSTCGKLQHWYANWAAEGTVEHFPGVFLRIVAEQLLRWRHWPPTDDMCRNQLFYYLASQDIDPSIVNPGRGPYAATCGRSPTGGQFSPGPSVEIQRIQILIGAGSMGHQDKHGVVDNVSCGTTGDSWRIPTCLFPHPFPREVHVDIRVLDCLIWSLAAPDDGGLVPCDCYVAKSLVGQW